MDKEKQILFEWLRTSIYTGQKQDNASVETADRTPAFLEDASFKSAYEKLLSSHLAAVVFESSLTQQLGERDVTRYDVMKAQTKETAVQFYRNFSFFGQLVQQLSAENITFYVLKGFGLCSLYPKEEMRYMGDIDLYIPDSRQYKRAIRLFEQQGYQCAQKESAHHAEYYCQWREDIIKCELHHFLVDKIGSRRVFLDLHKTMEEQLLQAKPVQETVMGTTFPVLPPTLHLWYLLLHMFHHFLGFGIGIRALCDIALFIQKKGAEMEAELFALCLKKSKMTQFAKVVFALCEECFAVKIHAGLAEALRADATQSDRLPTEAFLTELWEYDEKTAPTERTPINLEKYTFISYIKTCHKQMKYHFPKASKVCLLWPVLWLLVIVRFLRRAKKGTTESSELILEKNNARRELARKLAGKDM